MGQYFVAANHDRQQFIQPHAFGDGLKFGEFTGSTHGFMLAVAWLLRRDEYTAGLADDSLLGSWAKERASGIVLVGDYHGDGSYHEIYENYEDISLKLLKELVEGDHVDRETMAGQVRWRMLPAMSSPEEQAEYRTFLGDLL
jgi:hypothetical protein